MPSSRQEKRQSPSRRKPPAAVLRGVRVLLCDVDGVLTDATVLMSGEEEFKRFDIRDGLGLVLARRAGLRVGWISSRPSEATTRRARELGIDYLRQEKRDKVLVAEEILKSAGFNWGQTCYVGDDLVDLGPMRRAAFSVAVADAVPEVKQAADFVTSAAGGEGAVREVCEMILKVQQKWVVEPD